ncbi:MAG TPA: porin [Tepidisphaeraceae bacterium]|nr:porin [Tepidisphaeraceae bacterium]
MILTGLAGSAALAAPSTQPSAMDQQLLDRINALEIEVHQLKAQQRSQQQPQQQQTGDGAAILGQIQSDADRQSQFLDQGLLTAGYANRRFFIQSEDGNFVLRPWVHIEIRDSTSWRQNFFPHGSDDTENGFEIRRARLGFDGNLFTPDFTYFINWATNRENSTLTVTNSAGATVGTTTSPVGGLPVLEEAWAKYNFHDTPWYIHVGQMHDPLDHENMVGSKYRAPEASLQGDIFGNTDTFTQAATVIFDNKQQVRAEAGVTDGIRAANTNFEDSPNNGIGYDGGVAGRVEWKLMGNWKDYDQLTAYGDKKDLLVLGTGYDYSYAGAGYNQLSHTLDLQYGSPSGLFAYICYFGRYTEHNKGIPATSGVSASFNSSTPDLGKDTYEPSIDAEIAYAWGNWEPFGRYEYMYLRGTPAGSQNNVTDLSLGVNYYFYGHNLKFTGLATYLPTGIPINDDSSDVLVSNRKAEVVFITQLQLLL